MNQLQKEILQAILKDGKGPQAQAEAAAEVCFIWIGKALSVERAAMATFNDAKSAKSWTTEWIERELTRDNSDAHRTETKETE